VRRNTGAENHGQDIATGAPVDTFQPNPAADATNADGSLDAGKGTVHLILGGGGTSAPLDVYGVDAADGAPQAKLFTKPNRPIPSATTPGAFTRGPADAVEDAIWSAPTRSRRRTTSCSRPRCCRSTRSTGGTVSSRGPADHVTRTSIVIRRPARSISIE
jgi:hypothetical protein